MRSKKELCRNWRLYVITTPGAGLAEKIRQALLGGADVVQLRDKLALDDDLVRLARQLMQVTQSMNAPLIINDRVRVAQAAGADGIHLGQEDGSLADAKSILGEDIFYGRSTHSPEQGRAAQKEGFDYIGVGPVFETPTKAGRAPVGLGYVEFAANELRLPFVAIGGIDERNMKQVREAGASAIAVVRAVMQSPDIRSTARKLKEGMI